MQHQSVCGESPVNYCQHKSNDRKNLSMVLSQNIPHSRQSPLRAEGVKSNIHKHATTSN